MNFLGTHSSIVQKLCTGTFLTLRIQKLGSISVCRVVVYATVSFETHLGDSYENQPFSQVWWCVTVTTWNSSIVEAEARQSKLKPRIGCVPGLWKKISSFLHTRFSLSSYRCLLHKEPPRQHLSKQLSSAMLLRSRWKWQTLCSVMLFLFNGGTTDNKHV